MHLDTYLTEGRLHGLLQEFCVSRGYATPIAQPPVPGTRMRFDFEIHTPSGNSYVEFDGDSHYRDATVMYRDSLKQAFADSSGFRLVRVPYFVQLDSTVFEHYFLEPFDISTSFPHGFHTTKVLPASFCGLGLKRFYAELEALPRGVREAVWASLEAKALSLPSPFVFPQA